MPNKQILGISSNPYDSHPSAFLKVYMELGSYFLFLQEQIKDIIIRFHVPCSHQSQKRLRGSTPSRLVTRLTNPPYSDFFPGFPAAQSSLFFPGLPRIRGQPRMPRLSYPGSVGRPGCPDWATPVVQSPLFRFFSGFSGWTNPPFFPWDAQAPCTRQRQCS